MFLHLLIIFPTFEEIKSYKNEGKSHSFIEAANADVL